MNNKKILVTGGAGYIGAHMVNLLLEQEYTPIVFDNLSTGYRDFVPKNVVFIQGDLKNKSDVEKVFKKHKIDSVIHFASSLVVSESSSNPLKYYENNIYGTINLLRTMLENKVYNIIFSSTSAVYGNSTESFVSEDMPTNPVSPYGKTKLIIEQMLEDISKSSELKYISLRYFNVIGSHPKCNIGIRDKNTTFLIPNIMRVVCGKKDFLSIYGNDYETPDGTCIRDYIHIIDLCYAHLYALQSIHTINNQVFNVGTGQSHSVKEILDIVELITNTKINYVFSQRRLGDVGKIVSNVDKINKVLNWRFQTRITESLKTSLNWYKNNE